VEEDSHMEEVYANDEGEAEEWPVESPNDDYHLDDDDSALAKALAESMNDHQQPGASQAQQQQ